MKFSKNPGHNKYAYCDYGIRIDASSQLSLLDGSWCKKCHYFWSWWWLLLSIYLKLTNYIYTFSNIYIYSIYKVFKQRKQLIWNLKFHADTAAIFSQMNKTLNLQYNGIFSIIWRHIKVFAKCFQGKSVYPVTRWATGRRSQPDSWKQ